MVIDYSIHLLYISVVYTFVLILDRTLFHRDVRLDIWFEIIKNVLYLFDPLLHT